MTVPVLIEVELHKQSALAEDDVVMTFPFVRDSLASTDGLALLVEEFFNDPTVAPGLVRTPAGWLARCISRTVKPTIKAYDLTGHLDGSPHGSPFFVSSFSSNLLAAAGAGPDLPAEMALAVSYHADLTGLPEVAPGIVPIPSTHEAIRQGAPATHPGQRRPKAQHRGRFFFGPLVAGAVAEDASGDVRATNTICTDLANQAMSVLAPGGWAVWSRAGAVMNLVTGVTCDNALDTQRRRGVGKTLTIAKP